MDFGIAPQRAIDSVVRAVGRIVVWVEAEADVSTQIVSSLYSGDPSTPWPSGLSTSLALEERNAVPWKACAAVVTIR